MKRDLLLGMDLGTSAIKTILFSREGRIVASASISYPTVHPYPAWAEQDPASWWNAARMTIRSVLAEAGEGAAQRIAGVSASCQAPTMLPLDESGQPLHPGVIWFDKRGADVAEHLRKVIGDEFVGRVNGNKIDAYYGAVKMVWFKNHYPDLYARTHKFLQINSWINYRLTGTYSTDFSHGPLILLFDSRRGDWSPELCQAFGIDIEKLPPISQCSEVIGEVTPAAAAETGLLPGTPVVAGGVDTPAAVLGDGVFCPGQAFLSMGTGANVGVCLDHPVNEPRMIVLPHLVPGIWLIDGVTTACGGSLRWFRDQIGVSGQLAAQMPGVSDYEVLNREAETAPPGSGGVIFLPYMMGEQAPIWDAAARGVFFGLSLNTKKSQLVRAVMEGCAYGLRHNLEVIEAQGIVVKTIRLSGGPTRSAVWNQIWADVTGKSIEITDSPMGAPVGDAILAGVGVGVFSSWGEPLAMTSQVQTCYEPRQEFADRYAALYEIYRGLYPSLAPYFRQLSEVP